MNRFKIILISISILGITTPFIGYFVIIEMFYLLIPFAIILLISSIIFIINLIRYKTKIAKQKSTKLIVLLPTFLVLQVLSTFLIDKIQRFRAEQIIAKLEKNEKQYPKSITVNFGITYEKFEKFDYYEIEYDRGFFVKEVYNSNKKLWKSYGWND